ncbi:MAG: septum formation initiator family protein [Chloroflexota bacterium]|nr:septum formation initiator family protein [Chloroflexota bacterium]
MNTKSSSSQNNDRAVRARGGQVNSVQVMFAVILAVVLLLAINFSSRISAAQPLQEAFTRVQTEIDQLETEHVRLTALRDAVMSDAYVESWARDDGKMMRPGEMLYVPVPSGVAVEEAVPPLVVMADIETSEAEPESWELWWALFFDSPPPDGA